LIIDDESGRNISNINYYLSFKRAVGAKAKGWGLLGGSLKTLR